MDWEEYKKTWTLLCPTCHTMKLRAFWHDYGAKSTYLVTLVTEGRIPWFGSLELGPEPHIRHTLLGQQIMENEIKKIHQLYPMMYVWAKCLMPDHLHLLVHVESQLPNNCKLGNVISGFKVGCHRAWREIYGKDEDKKLFEEGFNDRILLDDGQLERWRHYIKDNPRRLALKWLHRDLFKVIRDKMVAGLQCEVIGNIFLLDIPEKMAVVVHRADSDEVYREKVKRWLAFADRGGVLVSAAISPRERPVMRAAMNRGYRIILLRENGFPQYYKPSGEAFDACARGQLLQISPDVYHYDRRTITRAQCLSLNRLALDITDGA